MGQRLGVCYASVPLMNLLLGGTPALNGGCCAPASVVFSSKNRTPGFIGPGKGKSFSSHGWEGGGVPLHKQISNPF